MFWTHMLGMHPQTGQPVDQFDCSMRWLPIMLVENGRHIRGVQAATESMRNEVVTRQDVLNNAVLNANRAAKEIKNVPHEADRLESSNHGEKNGR
ncbi:hypothetical protein [Paraburkholderia sp. Ac-20347]|uniref:hypothetical protein n=1 Tax=Paraburkholderia sp. Ac-20347 TaxID=2703892 RepID=UPI00198126EB|nr:hypothetical protein [Paraburkholderia sp. Ac-20347]MBN3809412.1 hypothetical protein [Paraburkholderia sp. Ac-20347]